MFPSLAVTREWGVAIFAYASFIMVVINFLTVSFVVFPFNYVN